MKEPFFARPYRSVWRNLWWNLSRVPYFLQTWWAYRKVLWHDQDFDHSYLWALLEFKLRRMADSIGNGHTLHRERDAKRILLAASLCSRLHREDHLFKFQHDAAPDFVTIDWQHTEYLHKQDLEYVTNMLRKYSRMWWD